MNPSALYRAIFLSKGNGALRRSQNGLAPFSVPFRPAAPNDGGPVIWPAAKFDPDAHPSLVTRRRGCDILNLAGAAFFD